MEGWPILQLVLSVSTQMIELCVLEGSYSEIMLGHKQVKLCYSNSVFGH